MYALPLKYASRCADGPSGCPAHDNDIDVAETINKKPINIMHLHLI